ncbi:uncharacterized protein LOC108112770 [Drosophila eugracilis]|uniref:uncharacterized protein LOC108112770 n=1 Tax=Drosophila eugracilis TaxID=29029 RepID=UPI0007E699FF|nr:uncharacterized protein LOC108112770 [Drosophila eugracilis]XP_017078523.1 uncharacterized protein LOC108112770 [Drosophila eugracilis]
MQHGSSRITKQEALPNAISGPDSSNWTSLHEAVAAGDDRRVEGLLFSNADRLARESLQGNTPLHEAASRGFSRCVKLICTPPTPPTSSGVGKPGKGQKDKDKDKDKNKGRAKVVHQTIEALHNSALSIANNEGLSALHLAAQNGHNQSSRELLLAGADPDVQNNYGDTPLHTACRYGHAGVTRILLSALCDPNKTNLNGDTALHITCAMGRRKLTRILLEADARLGIKNAQGDCPMHIAIRKNYREIIEILNTPKKIRNRKEKPKEGGSRSDKDRDRDRDVVDKGINWSPYGCHYFPDPRAFPSPKLETLPKEPLKPGEQYFLDLAGHIHKGPVSVGNTCYCGPFFRHIENKLNCNRKSLKKYVHKTKERLGHKVQALAIKTNDQIEQLTRTMIEDRLRCESKRQHLSEFLRRGEPMRSTFDQQNRNSRIERTLSRCRSLELLENNHEASRLTNSRSVDLLEDQAVEAIVHRSAEVQLESDSDEDSNEAGEEEEEEDGGEEEVQDDAEPEEEVQQLEHSKLDELKLDFLKVSERLGVLLEKTTLIMERDSEKDVKHQLSSLSPPYKPHPRAESVQLREDKESVNSPNFDEYTNVMRRYPNSSETSNPSQNSNSWDWEASPTGSNPQPDYHKYYQRIGRGENMLNSVIKALRKDASFADMGKEEAVNESAERIGGDKLLYKEQASEAAGISNLMKRQPLCLEDNYPAMSNLFYSNPIMEYAEETEIRQNGNENISKVEIRNSEIKCLKKPNAGQVRDMVAQLQNTIDSNRQDSQTANVIAARSQSRLNNNFQHIEATSSNPSPTYSIPHRNTAQFGLPERHIPKDAYFHELPHRPPIPQNPQRRIHSGYAPNSNFYRNEDLYVERIPQPNSPIRQGGDYVGAINYRALQSQTFQAIIPPHPNPRNPRNWPHPSLPPNDIDLDELSAVGLYNNVSSLV